MLTGKVLYRELQRIIDIFLQSLIDWIIPPVCCVCGTKADKTPFLCNSCYHKLEIFGGTPDSIRYHKDKPADIVFSFYFFNDVFQSLAHQLKYRGLWYTGKFIGKEMGRDKLADIFSDCDAVVPIPLHHIRKRERTFNQAEMIAGGLSTEWGIPLRNCLRRKIATGTQTLLNKDERQENIRGVFEIQKHRQIPRFPCVVDDVFTTGATTMEAARTLKNAGAERVAIFTAATPRHGQSSIKNTLGGNDSPADEIDKNTRKSGRNN